MIRSTGAAYSLYTRIRGRVQGPFHEEELRRLIRQGVLSRMHELSDDQVNWVRADTVSELFLSATPFPYFTDQPQQVPLTPVDDPPRQRTPREGPSREAEEAPAPSPAPAPEPCYFYSRGGVQSGPVAYSVVQAMLHSGQLSGDDFLSSDDGARFGPIRSFGEFVIGGAGTKGGNKWATPAEQPVATLATVSFVLGMLWLGGLASLAAIACGLLAVQRIQESRGTLSGLGYAWCGVGLGALGIGLTAVLIWFLGK